MHYIMHKEELQTNRNIVVCSSARTKVAKLCAKDFEYNSQFKGKVSLELPHSSASLFYYQNKNF